MMQDETLNCRDCGVDFIFSVGEQEFYDQKGYTNKPARCPTCRQKRKAGAGSGDTGPSYSSAPPRRVERELFPAICAQCGVETRVPFRPTQGKPVYCSDCYRSKVVTR
ncbi:MAG: zinc-ribbon domain containing protein [Cyanobacteria bacterium NC_groundwater_1444_Ag_S-0.65um_54_12]|nr:zinc-ribbon domain containing protein [Cyanobacteria bacterium NC_groundwater_1444_Ag_S-0.65um_54_12]